MDLHVNDHQIDTDIHKCAQTAVKKFNKVF